MGSLAQRIRGAGPKAYSDAGPRDRDILLALAAAGLIDIVLAVLFHPMPLAVYVAVATVLALVVSIRDRDGPLIREAMSYVAQEQTRRASSRVNLALTPRAAARLLETDHPEATLPEHASILATAGRPTEAAAVMEAFEAVTPADRVGKARMIASLAAAADPAATMDVDAIRMEAAELEPEARRYHIVAAAWTRAWLDIQRGRPWRVAFLAVAREFAPYEIPRRLRARFALQQHIAPITLAGVAVFLLAFELSA